MLFVSMLHREGLAPGTVKSYMAAVRFEQISRGMGDPWIPHPPANLLKPAAQQGLQDSLIKTLGRWESSAYTSYIRTPPATLCKVAKSLVSATTP